MYRDLGSGWLGSVVQKFGSLDLLFNVRNQYILINLTYVAIGGNTVYAHVFLDSDLGQV